MQLNNRNINFMLAVIALALLAICVMSVLTPMRFSSERERREALVKQRLVLIRQAQDAYRTAHGHYAPSLDSLALADSLKLIPYADGQHFELNTATKEGKDGHAQPLMECGARYKAYLNGLDKREVNNLTEEAVATDRYPGLKIGDLNNPNNNAGNWE